MKKHLMDSTSNGGAGPGDQPAAAIQVGTKQNHIRDPLVPSIMRSPVAKRARTPPVEVPSDEDQPFQAGRMPQKAQKPRLRMKRTAVVDIEAMDIDSGNAGQVPVNSHQVISNALRKASPPAPVKRKYTKKSVLMPLVSDTEQPNLLVQKARPKEQAAKGTGKTTTAESWMEVDNNDGDRVPNVITEDNNIEGEYDKDEHAVRQGSRVTKVRDESDGMDIVYLTDNDQRASKPTEAPENSDHIQSETEDPSSNGVSDVYRPSEPSSEDDIFELEKPELKKGRVKLFPPRSKPAWQTVLLQPTSHLSDPHQPSLKSSTNDQHTDVTKSSYCRSLPATVSCTALEPQPVFKGKQNVTQLKSSAQLTIAAPYPKGLNDKLAANSSDCGSSDHIPSQAPNALNSKQVLRDSSKHNKLTSKPDNWVEFLPITPHPPLKTQTLPINKGKGKGKGKEKQTLLPVSRSQSSKPTPARLEAPTFDEPAMNEFGSIPDRDEWIGDEQHHALLSPPKGGQQLDNSMIKRTQTSEDDLQEAKNQDCHEGKKRDRFKYEDLPLELKQSDKWNMLIMPPLLKWASTQKDPWNLELAAIVEALTIIYTGEESVEYHMATLKITYWKNALGVSTVWILDTFFKTWEDKFKTDKHSDEANGYKEVEPHGLLESELFLHVLATHYSRFHSKQSVWVPGLSSDSKDHEPWGLLAISCSVLACAIALWNEGHITIAAVTAA
ncbi:hypothetical protein NP233_g12413 [Leucocoprinus birnbaumii]|uniref:Uncharacterized protein n=1 Tax=Leucocoprinus birnbaumii TaxID=56174 RepID=A0AAD5VES4_9AGAR|nr:hypothetical protein NP233_g12413 [Leucocoprinus birnbaumii]